LGFDFRVGYKPGATNAVVDTLSQHDPEVQAFTMALSFASFKLYDELHGEYDTDSTLASQRQEVLDGSLSD
jgi:hypothetical protein